MLERSNFGRFGSACAFVLLSCACTSSGPAKIVAGVMPAPLDDQPGERESDFRQRRAEWIEQLHRAAPGVDWRRMDAEFRGERLAVHEAQRRASLAQGKTPADWNQVRTPAVSGNWVERGSNNQAGRVVATALDASNNRLTVFSHGGNVWRASRALLDWSSPNDGATFVPYYSAGFMDRLAGVAGERLLVPSDRPTGVFRSDDGGLTWQSASGLGLANPDHVLAIAHRAEALDEVYLLRSHYDFTAPAAYKPHLFSSTDRGASFVSRGFIGVIDQVALFAPRYAASTVYVLNGAQLSTITTGTQALQPVSTVPLGFSLAAGDVVALSGGVSSGGQTFLYAFYSRGATNNTAVFRSIDGGASWSAATAVPTRLATANSAEASTRDPLSAYAGGVNLYRTADGGASWTLVNDWTQYYSSPATRLHADIMNVDVWRDSGGNERIYVACDGGLFESTDNLLTVQNLSLSGLRISQYYGSYSRRVAPAAILAGAQDQGYQRALSVGGGRESFEQTISGDYAHLESTDGGQKVWMVYPTFLQLDTATTVAGQGGLRSWDFGANSFSGTYFLPALGVDPLNSSHLLLAGGRIGGTGNHLIDLSYNGSSISGTQIAFDFVTAVTAVAFSADGSTRYAMNSDSQFFRQQGAGAWTPLATGLPPEHFFFGNRILPDPVTPGKIYVAGSGYSNPGVYVSTTNGSSFVAMATGLPNTMVFDLAISSDGLDLFAATEVGPYYYDRGLAQWVDISGLAAPDQPYWDVDFVDGERTARFSTYGRGVWDFALNGLDVLFKNGFE